MEKILITGGAGYIGSICTEFLLDLGYKVVVFDNLSEGHREAVDPRATLIVGDLNDKEAINKTISDLCPDAVMHFAANALVGESMKNPSKYFNNNINGGLNLLDAMVAHGVSRIVFSSTCAIFGIPTQVPIDETFVKQPINPYGESKLIFERILEWYGKIYNINFVALRYFNAAGASEKLGEMHRTETHLIPNIFNAALGITEHVEIYGSDYDTPDGTCIRDYIHILDLAQAHALALQSPKSSFYNLGTGGGNSVKEVIYACEKIIGKAIKTIEKPRRPGDPPRLIASSKKIESDLGWKPRFQSIEAIVESAWRWQIKNL